MNSPSFSIFAVEFKTRIGVCVVPPRVWDIHDTVEGDLQGLSSLATYTRLRDTLRMLIMLSSMLCPM